MRTAQGRVHLRGEVRPERRAAGSAEPARVRRAHPRDDPHALPEHERGRVPRSHRDRARPGGRGGLEAVRHEEGGLQEEGRGGRSCGRARGGGDGLPHADRAVADVVAEGGGRACRPGSEGDRPRVPLRVPRRLRVREAPPAEPLVRAARRVPPPQARVLPRERSARAGVRCCGEAHAARHGARDSRAGRAGQVRRGARGDDPRRAAGRACRRRREEGGGDQVAHRMARGEGASHRLQRRGAHGPREVPEARAAEARGGGGSCSRTTGAGRGGRNKLRPSRR